MAKARKKSTIRQAHNQKCEAEYQARLHAKNIGRMKDMGGWNEELKAEVRTARGPLRPSFPRAASVWGFRLGLPFGASVWGWRRRARAAVAPAPWPWHRPRAVSSRAWQFEEDYMASIKPPPGVNFLLPAPKEEDGPRI